MMAVLFEADGPVGRYHKVRRPMSASCTYDSGEAFHLRPARASAAVKLAHRDKRRFDAEHAMAKCRRRE